jgi:hypothetical protein
VELPKIGLLVLSASPRYLSLKSSKQSIDEIEATAIANHLETENQLFFVHNDLKILAERIAQFRRKSLTQAQRVYLALRAIGRPAHYSEVTDSFNSLFPDLPSTEHNIHAILGREQHGIVWIGIRGTYALKEWGYQHPSKTLFETVVEIVENIYEQTGKPVPFTNIMAEIGRYRKITNIHSLTIATHCNPNLRHISKNSFIPKAPDDQVENEVSAEQLDKILQEFRTSSESKAGLS